MKTIPITIQVQQFENGDILLFDDQLRHECYVLIEGQDTMIWVCPYSEMIEIYDYDPDL